MAGGGLAGRLSGGAGHSPPGTRTRRVSSLRKLLKSPEYTQRVLITDKLRSYGAAKREVMASVEHRKASI